MSTNVQHDIDTLDQAEKDYFSGLIPYSDLVKIYHSMDWNVVEEMTFIAMNASRYPGFRAVDIKIGSDAVSAWSAQDYIDQYQTGLSKEEILEQINIDWQSGDLIYPQFCAAMDLVIASDNVGEIKPNWSAKRQPSFNPPKELMDHLYDVQVFEEPERRVWHDYRRGLMTHTELELYLLDILDDSPL